MTQKIKEGGTAPIQEEPQEPEQNPEQVKMALLNSLKGRMSMAKR